jgi:hypothetical protein
MSKFSDLDGLSAASSGLYGDRLRRISYGHGNGPVLNFNWASRTAASMAVGPSIWKDSALIGVVTVGNPVAPALNDRGIVELDRLCIRLDLDPMLPWNCCSKLYRTARTRLNVVASPASSPIRVGTRTALACMLQVGPAKVRPRVEVGIAAGLLAPIAMLGS